jgi:hypothetical protein
LHWFVESRESETREMAFNCEERDARLSGEEEEDNIGGLKGADRCHV